ncbi:hypothetical protein XCR1_2680010 [Xenorhabdus cabanillasii JM26]|uniref:Uncharacterized protein n=1 Tax=Xenorhabdus cabanillasii JM26 TaxID=1427517 RepID=W1J837_9GAMM|nr:hypothetical protein XCR1_2680010 [Xenorhabdus cabanillasii JM26]
MSMILLVMKMCYRFRLLSGVPKKTKVTMPQLIAKKRLSVIVKLNKQIVMTASNIFGILEMYPVLFMSEGSL